MFVFRGHPQWMISNTIGLCLINRVGRVAFLLLWLIVVPAHATTFQFEVIGASEEWVAIRENVPVSPDALDSCRYPGLDPSLFIGVKVHFLRLTEELKRGVLSAAAPFESSSTIYEPSTNRNNCTPPEVSAKNWKELENFAEKRGLRLTKQAPPHAILGTPVPVRECVVIEKLAKEHKKCDRIFKTIVDGKRLEVAISLGSVPEASDEKKCQFIGHRFGATLQVRWLDFGSFGSGSAPGGFAVHFDCRPQQFMPLRLYLFEDKVVLLVSFRGDNIADREEYPYLLVFPRFRPK